MARGDPKWVNYSPSKANLAKTAALKPASPVTSARVQSEKGRLSDSIREKVSNYRSFSDKRGSATRGWSAIRPWRKGEKEALPKECFLIPEARKFPVCPAGSAKLSPVGVQAAYIRAKQWKYHKVADAAKELLDHIHQEEKAAVAKKKTHKKTQKTSPRSTRSKMDEQKSHFEKSRKSSPRKTRQATQKKTQRSNLSPSKKGVSPRRVRTAAAA